MGITVREAMQIGGLKKCRIIAGEDGLDRIINHVTVMEIPDVVGWLKGNDLLLSSLFPIKDDKQALSKLISKLHQAGSSVLAVKNRYFEEIPVELIMEANRFKLPLIEINNEITYLDIITPLMKEILREGTTNQDKIDEFFKWITELALGGKGISVLVQAVESFLENPVTIESEISKVEDIKNEQIEKLSRDQIKELIRSNRAVRMVRRINQKDLPVIVAPILLNNEPNGFITCWEVNRNFEMLDFIVVERLISLFALEFLKTKTRLAIDQEYKSNFLYDVLNGRINSKFEVIEKARVFSWDLSKDYQVIVLQVDKFNNVLNIGEFEGVINKEFKNKMLNRIEEITENDSIVTLVSDMVVILSPTTQNEKQLKTFVERIKKRLNSEMKELIFTIGIGRTYPSIEGIHLGYNEALQSIKIGRLVWGENRIVHFNDLGVYRLLTQIQNKEELTHFCDETVQPLVNYDKENNSKLVDTVTEYFYQNYSLVDTAKSLFIHVNTLKYRLEKVEHLTCLSVNSAEDRLKLHLGIKIIKML